MTEDDEPFAMEVGEIRVTRFLDEDGDIIDNVVASRPDGEDMPLTEALGMMRLAEDTLIRERMGDEG